MSNDSITPIRKQYLDIKRQHPDTILFFRLGDFYETFDKDAEITSKILDIVLTSRSVAKGQRIPMAGIPYHAAENYIGKLIDQGFHVAICEQIGDQPKKGLVSRQVVRIITPGTIIEPNLLKNDRNNYLMAILIEDAKAGLSYADITTGEFAATQIEGEDLLPLIKAEISRIHPAELLIPETQNYDLADHFNKTTLADWHFETDRCISELMSQFQVASLEGFGFNQKSLGIRAAGAIVQYLKDTEPAVLKLFTQVLSYSLEDHMILDSATRRNLELTETIRQNNEDGSLLGVIDNTVSPMGKRLIRQWINKPLLSIPNIDHRLDAVDLLVKDGLVRSELKSILRHVADLERLVNRIISLHAIPRDLVSLRQTLLLIPEIHKIIESHLNPIQEIINKFYLCEEELSILNQAIAADPPATLQNVGIIKPGFSEELDQLVINVEDARNWISNLEKAERKRTGIKNLKVGYNKIFGYYIEITNAKSEMVPADYIRKQTLVNAERYITPEMKEYEALVLNAEEQIHAVELRLFNQICQTLSSKANEMLSTAKSLAELDVFCSFSETAVHNNYCRPQLLDDCTFDIKDGRHPVVEQARMNQLFVPNDVHFSEGELIRIITGPNMSGKSTYLRQVALIVLMAQIGSFVPAAQARIGIVDRIFTRIGAQDEIFAGQSTFMVEMVETANILNNATNRSLLILDEIGRGTSTYDGLSIAWAVVEYIHNHPKLRARTLFATHYHELTQLSELLPFVRNFNVAVSEADNQVVFLHKIIPGGADKSYGVHVAQLAGLPASVTQRANELLTQLEQSSKDNKKMVLSSSQQMNLFPETNPLIEELNKIDLNSMSPLDALNKLYEWQKKYSKK